MHAVGVDLSGPSNFEDTVLVGVRRVEGDGWRLETVESGLGDGDIVDSVVSQASTGGERVAVGLDAPLSYNSGGGLRERDRALREQLRSAGHPVRSVMAPTMTRMIYLTARGMTVARQLREALEVDILEVHPTSALYFRADTPDHVERMKEEPAVRGELVDALAFGGSLEALRGGSDHTVAAAAAARATADWLDGDACYEYGSDPPAHPHPLVC